jgi:hypothetical protein
MPTKEELKKEIIRQLVVALSGNAYMMHTDKSTIPMDIVDMAVKIANEMESRGYI